MSNGTLLQSFHWYTPADGSWWNQLTQQIQDLANLGFTALWLPPAYKGAAGSWDVGYGVYDMYDLGEFDQKGSVRTKYGTRDQYLAIIQAAHQAGLQVYADMVFNHRGGADATECVKAIRVLAHDRNFTPVKKPGSRPILNLISLNVRVSIPISPGTIIISTGWTGPRTSRSRTPSMNNSMSRVDRCRFGSVTKYWDIYSYRFAPMLPGFSH